MNLTSPCCQHPGRHVWSPSPWTWAGSSLLHCPCPPLSPEFSISLLQCWSGPGQGSPAHCYRPQSGNAGPDDSALQDSEGERTPPTAPSARPKRPLTCSCRRSSSARIQAKVSAHPKSKGQQADLPIHILGYYIFISYTVFRWLRTMKKKVEFFF